MSNAHAQLAIEVTLRDPVLPPASVAAELAPPTSEPRKAFNALWRLFNAIAGGLRTAKVRVRVDSVTDYAAYLDLAVTQANIAVGETIDIAIPGVGTFRLTAVASAADVTLGQFVSETNDNTTATNIRAAINGMIGLKDWVVASGGTNHVIITALRAGTWGNGITVINGTGTGLSPSGGALAGGLDPDAQVTATAALVHANIAADDTITIAGVVFTWKVAAASEDQVTIGANVTADGDNLAAKINAHSKLLGVVTATNNAGTLTLTYRVPARIAILLLLATSDGNSATLTQPATNLTLANTQATREYSLLSQS